MKTSVYVYHFSSADVLWLQHVLSLFWWHETSKVQPRLPDLMKDFFSFQMSKGCPVPEHICLSRTAFRQCELLDSLYGLMEITLYACVEFRNIEKRFEASTLNITDYSQTSLQKNSTYFRPSEATLEIEKCLSENSFFVQNHLPVF